MTVRTPGLSLPSLDENLRTHWFGAKLAIASQPPRAWVRLPRLNDGREIHRLDYV